MTPSLDFRTSLDSAGCATNPYTDLTIRCAAQHAFCLKTVQSNCAGTPLQGPAKKMLLDQGKAHPFEFEADLEEDEDVKGCQKLGAFFAAADPSKAKKGTLPSSATFFTQRQLFSATAL